MQVKRFSVNVTFITKSGVRVSRNFVLTDTFRSNAEYRAQKLVPKGSTVVQVAS